MPDSFMQTIRLGGPVVVPGGPTRVRLFVGPLLPGDQVDELRIQLQTSAATVGAQDGPLTVSAKLFHTRETNTDAAFDNGTVTILDGVTVPFEFDLIDTTIDVGTNRVRADLPCWAFVTPETRYLVIDMRTPNGNAAMFGFALVKVFRRPPDGK